MFKLDTLAVPAKHAMSAQTRVERMFFSPYFEKKEAKISFNSYFLRIDTAEDEHSEKYTRGLILTKKRIVKNVFRVPPVLGSIVKNLEKAMVLPKGYVICFL